MGQNLERWPSWAEASMQGLAFWIGHRRALFAGHPLPEAALVAEACNLIQAHLETGSRLEVERAYRDIVSPHRWRLNGETRARADLVVRGPRGAITIIEVKRASAARQLIDRDLRRLAAAKAVLPKSRCFLFVVSESRRPSRFVSKKGKSVLKLQPIPGRPNESFKVRRTCKAAAAFGGKSTAHYACIVEILAKVVGR